jgi:hypothetical protein
VFPRKIDVWFEGGVALPPGQRWTYAWSTNAYRTCRDAVRAAKAKHPGVNFKANFNRK